MDISRDDLRRDLRDAQAEQRAVAKAWRETLLGVFGSKRSELSADERAELALGGLSRRRMLHIGGFGVATTAVLAACGAKKPAAKVALSGTPASIGSAPEQVIDDIVLLRTASSLERSAVAVYATVLSKGLLPDKSMQAAAKLFQDHHTQHAKAFEAATKEAGGEAYTKANPVVDAGVIQPALAAILKETGAAQVQAVLAFAHTLEGVAAATYQAITPTLTTGDLRATVMGIGGVENRHAAILAKLIDGSAPVKVNASSTASTTTTVKSSSGQAAETVYQVTGPFASQGAAIGPNSYTYYTRAADATTTTTTAASCPTS